MKHIITHLEDISELTGFFPGEEGYYLYGKDEFGWNTPFLTTIIECEPTHSRVHRYRYLNENEWKEILEIMNRQG